MTAVSMGQDLYITNLDQLVAEAYSTDHSVYLPLLPWDWRAYSLNGGEPWWLDCSQVSCDPLFQTPTELSAGVPAYTVVLIQNLLTGETTIQPDGSSDVVATIAAPSNYQAVTNSWNRWMWDQYQEVIDQPDSWGFSPEEVPPPTITLKAVLADVNNYATFQGNLEAQVEAAQAAQAMTASMNSRLMPMDDDDGGDGGDPPPPDGTGIEPVPSGDDPPFSLLQPFTVTTVQPTSRGVRITWQSSQWSRYLIWYANDLTSNTVWIPQAYVWGAANSNGVTVGLTSYTDTTSTNLNHRFYRVQRLFGSNPPIAAGSSSSVVIRSDGTLWAWGDNGGEVGDGLISVSQPDGNIADAGQPYPGPVANVVPCDAPQTITNPVAVAAGGDDFTVVADGSGTVWTFGENSGAQLGNGTGPCFFGCPSIATPAPISGLANIVAVAAGYQHALALSSAGTVSAWGNNSGSANAPSGAPLTGQLGIGGVADQGCSSCATNVPVATQFPTGVVIVAVAAGSYYSVALDSSGNVWTWGDNYYGQLGNGTNGNCADNHSVTVPNMLTTISNVIAIAAGDSHTVALRADKTVWTWGAYGNGQLGRTITNDCRDCCMDSLPGQVVAAGLSNNVVAIAAGAGPSGSGNGFTLAVTSNGLLYAWGDNSVGELGTFNTSQVGAGGVDSSTLPMLVADISNVVWVSAPRPNDGCNNVPPSGACHSLVMTLDQGTNHYWGFGDNTLGAIGVTTTTGTGTVVDACNNSDNFVSIPTGPVQFCTRCQREVQLGTSGSFTAQCKGMLYLYFNDDYSAFSDNAGSFSASIGGFGPTNLQVTVMATNYNGVAVGMITQGSNYTFSASGYCTWNKTLDPQPVLDPNGTDTNAVTDCSNPYIINLTNAVCPTAKCFSLVGKVQ
jgi:alpha-tubulin suppressor-like RCC1 family protein